MGLSVLIPSRNEKFLNKTIQDILDKSEGEIEILAVLDEGPPEAFIEDDRVSYLQQSSPKGMRAGINWAASLAKYDTLMKADGHCMFAQGFDKVLAADMQDNWVVIPRRHSLDAENWTILNNGKGPRDYHYLCFPDPHKGHDVGMHGVEWAERSRERLDPKYDIDDNMTCQGSCWYMKKSWFDNFLHGLSEVGYGTFSQEFQEIGNKTWLGGGEVKVNKKTWYCHLHKGKQYGRMYHMDNHEVVEGHRYSARHWMNNEEPGMIHPISWLVEKFWPLPGWDKIWLEDWEDQLRSWNKEIDG